MQRLLLNVWAWFVVIHLYLAHATKGEQSHWPRQWEFLSTQQHVIVIRRILYLPVHSNRFLYTDLQQSVWNLCMSAKEEEEERKCVKLNYFLVDFAECDKTQRWELVLTNQINTVMNKKRVECHSQFNLKII